MIRDYINSKDIRDYWNEINYSPSALEAAWLIWQGKNQTLKEKHTAWMSLVSEAFDCSSPNGDFDLPQQSLHEFIKRYIDLEKELLAAFYKNEQNAVYTYRIYFDDVIGWHNESAIFFDFDEAYEHARDLGAPPHPNFVEFIKTYIAVSGEAKRIFARFNLEKEVVRVDESNYFSNEKDYEIFQEVFRNMRFEFPTPFQKGDIVETVRGLYTRPSHRSGIFVLTSIGEMVYGLAIDVAGAAHCMCITEYMDLERIHKPLIKEDKALMPISKYLKEEMNLATFLNEYRYILATNDAKKFRLLTKEN